MNRRLTLFIYFLFVGVVWSKLRKLGYRGKMAETNTMLMPLLGPTSWDVHYNVVQDSNVTLYQVPFITPFRKFIRLLDYYLVPFIIAVGLIGNTISCIVFLTTKLRKLSSSVYLAALSISDMGFLLCVLASWTTNLGINLYHTNGWCQLFVFCQYVFSFLSVWYIVGFTVERFIAIRFPFKRGAMCTVRRAKIVVIFLATLAALLYNFGAWTAVVFDKKYYGTQMCLPDSKYHTLIHTMVNIDTFITLVMPSIVLIILNFNIICAVSHLHGRCQKLVNWGNTHAPNITAHVTQQERPPVSIMAGLSTNRSRTQVKITKMLLVVSSVFLILNLPSHSLRMFSFITTHLDPEKIPKPGSVYYGIEKLFTYIFYCSFSVNFFIYNLSGANFRTALKQMFMQCPCSKYFCKHRSGIDTATSNEHNKTKTSSTILLRTVGAENSTAL